MFFLWPKFTGKPWSSDKFSFKVLLREAGSSLNLGETANFAKTVISWKRPGQLRQEHRNYTMLLGWFVVCWLQYAFLLVKHLHKNCAAALSSNHQESKGRSCSFSSDPFFPCSARCWLCSAASRDFSLSFQYCWLLIDPPCGFPSSFCSFLFTGLKHWSWDLFLLVTWSIQTAMTEAALHASPAPFTPGLFSSTKHILEMCPTAQWRLSSFPYLLLF